MMKYIVILLILAVGFVAFKQVSNQSDSVGSIENVVKKSLKQATSTPDYKIDIDVEQTGIEKIDTVVALEAEFKAQQIAKEAVVREGAENPYSLDIYSQKHAAPVLGLESLVVTNQIYRGGAHGNIEYSTHTYSTQGGKEYGIDQIVDKDSESSRALFVSKLHAKSAEVNGADDYLTPEADDWSFCDDFYLTDAGLTCLFAPYDIAPYAHGEQTVSFTWEELAPHVRGWINAVFNPTPKTAPATTTATSTVPAATTTGTTTAN